MPITQKDNVFFMSEGASLRHDVLNEQNVSYRTHSHDFVEFIYMLNGECTHKVDQINYTLNRGDLLIINYGQMHTISGNSSAEYFNIFLKPEYISMSLANQNNAFALLNLTEFTEFQKIIDCSKCKLHFGGVEREKLEYILRNIESEFSNREAGHSLSTHSWFNLLLITVFRKMSLELTDGFQGISDALLLYIQQNYDRPIKLQDIAQMCFYNPSYFSRAFKQFCGMCFTDYLKSVRIQRATQLITDTDMNINDIYPKVGYSDKTKFFKHFREIVGLTPFEYRKCNK